MCSPIPNATAEGATLADPLEGPEYGADKAKIMRRADGSVRIHSFGHGRTVYELRYDFASIKAAIENKLGNEAARTFVDLVLAGDLDADEVEQLRDCAAIRSGVGKRTLDRKLKEAREEQRAHCAPKRSVSAAGPSDRTRDRKSQHLNQTPNGYRKWQ